MNIEKWFDLVSAASWNRIIESVSTGMVDLSDEGKDYLTHSFYAGISNGMISIDNEIKKFVEDISKIKLSLFQINKIKVGCENLLEIWIDRIIQKCEAERGEKLKDCNSLPNVNIEAFINGRKNEILANVALFVAIQKQLYWQRFMRVLFDVLRVAFSAFIGAIIGGFIINMFF